MSNKLKHQTKIFILFDGRAKSGDTDRATAIITANTESEAKRISRDYRNRDVVWYGYDMVKGVAVNETRRDDIGKGMFL